ncbi:MAG: HDOD domain-containing protein [Chromatiales bacterium]
MSLPAAYLKIKEIVDCPGSSTADIARAISADPALTRRLLRIVNSPFYGFSGKIETVSRALVVLGTQQVHDLALATAVGGLYGSVSRKFFDMERFWRESVYCALAARELARLCNVLDCDRLFVAGLLHGIGHLAMHHCLPEQAAAARRAAQQQGRRIDRVQREMIGCDYAEVGGLLLSKWNLPASLCGAVKYHLDPAKAQPPVLSESILHIAAWLTRAVLDGIAAESWHLPVAAFAWAQTELTADCFMTVKPHADAQLAATVILLRPDHRRTA